MTLRLTTSIGIAQWHEPAEEPSILVMRADAALYEAKQRGRDCIVVGTSETESFAAFGGQRVGSVSATGQALRAAQAQSLLQDRLMHDKSLVCPSPRARLRRSATIVWPMANWRTAVIGRIRARAFREIPADGVFPWLEEA